MKGLGLSFAVGHAKYYLPTQLFTSIAPLISVSYAASLASVLAPHNCYMTRPTDHLSTHPSAYSFPPQVKLFLCSY